MPRTPLSSSGSEATTAADVISGEEDRQREAGGGGGGDQIYANKIANERALEGQDEESNVGNSGEEGKSSEKENKRDADGVQINSDGIPVVNLSGSQDPFSPINMSEARKWSIVIVISSASFCVTCGSSMVAFTYPGVIRDFGVSHIVATLGLSLFVLGLGSAPLLLGPLSEFYGRNPIYRISYGMFLAWTLAVAFSNNIRISGAAFLSVAGGSVSDMFATNKVGAPMAIYTASPFLGPVAGPFFSGFINQHLDWRWTWYILAIWVAGEWAALLILVPETFLPALLVKKAKKLRKLEGRGEVRAPLELDKRSIPKVVLNSVQTPFQLLALEPMALALCIWTAILLGILYMFFSAFSIVYEPYGFNVQSVGLSFLGIGLGIIIGTACHPIWQKQYNRVARETGERPPPEEHLRKGMWGGILCPVALFWFAFTTYTRIHWSVSIVATIFFGVGLVWIFQAVFTYLIDAFRPVAASAMSANSALRSTFAAAFPLFTTQMFHKLGTQWSLALCAFLLLVMTPFPFLFFKYGANFRKQSRFANKE